MDEERNRKRSEIKESSLYVESGHPIGISDQTQNCFGHSISPFTVSHDSTLEMNANPYRDLFVVDVEFELGVFFDGVEYDTGVGLSNVDIRQQLLDLVVHTARVFELSDSDNIVVACGLVDTDHLGLITEPVDDFCERTPFGFKMCDSRYVVVEFSVIQDGRIPLNDILGFEIVVQVGS